MQNVNRQTMIGIADRLIALAKAGHPTMAEGFMEIDTGIYTDPAVYEAEKRAIFKRLWGSYYFKKTPSAAIISNMMTLQVLLFH